MSVPPRRTLRLLLPLAAWLAAAPPGRAHFVEPHAITLRPGGEDFVYVVDQATCPATITVTSSDPGVVQVFAVDMQSGNVLPGNGASASVPNRIDQVFLARAAPGATAPASAMLSVCWVGSDFPDPPCNENNCNPFQPHVVHVTLAADPQTAGAARASGVAQDPVVTGRGEYVLTERPDLASTVGPMELGFQRSYASLMQSDGNVATSLGPNWTHNFAWRLRRVGHNVEVTSPVGKVIRFQRGYFESDWKLAVYTDVPYQLVDDGTGFRMAEPTNQRIYSFDAAGMLTRVEDGRGNHHALTYVAGELLSASDARGHTLDFQHAGGRMTQVSDGMRTVDLDYDGVGRLEVVKGPTGGETLYGYDATAGVLALLTSRQRPAGNTPYTQVYDAQRRVASQTDAYANTFTFLYGPQLGRTRIGDPDGEQREHLHGNDLALDSWIDELGEDAALGNDGKDRRTSVTDRLGVQTSWTWHAGSGLLGSYTQAGGGKTTYHYTPRSFAGFTFHDLTGIDLPGGGSVAFGYDGVGNCTSYTDAGGNDWLWTYNGFGQVLTETNPAGGVVTHAYNLDGTLASREDAAGNSTTYGYDALDRVELITHEDGTFRAFTWNLLDQLEGFTDEEGATWAFANDANGNRTSVTDPLTHTWQLRYDLMDRRYEVEDPLGNIAGASFDAFGRIGELTDGGGLKLTVAYDVRGRPQGVQDPVAGLSLAFDAEARPTGSTNGVGEVLGFGSDALGRITRLTGPDGQSWRWAYDLLGDLTSATDPLGRRATITLDPRQLPVRFALPIAGSATDVTYGALGLPLALETPGGGIWSWTRDPSGRATSFRDPLQNETTFTYNLRNLLASKGLPPPLGFLNYSYDGVGRPTGVAHSGGDSASCSYDPRGLPLSGTGFQFDWDAAGRMTESNGVSHSYDGAGHMLSTTYGPGMTVTYGWNTRGLLETSTDWMGGVTSFQYDLAGRRTCVLRPNGIETHYTWDEGRLAEILDVDTNLPGLTLGRVRIDYGPTGRVASVDRELPLLSEPALQCIMYIFDLAARRMDAGYDALGRVTDDGARQFDWGGLSTLGSVTANGATVDYLYDWFRRVVGRKEGGVQLDFLRDYAVPGAPIVVEQQAGQQVRIHVVEPSGVPLYTVDISGARCFPHFDEAGDVSFVTDDAGDIAAAFAFDATGVVLDSTGQPASYHGWNGLSNTYVDGDLAFVDGGREVYDTATGRLVAPSDDWGLDPAQSNPYALRRYDEEDDGDPYGAAVAPPIILAHFDEAFSASQPGGGAAGDGDADPEDFFADGIATVLGDASHLRRRLAELRSPQVVIQASIVEAALGRYSHASSPLTQLGSPLLAGFLVQDALAADDGLLPSAPAGNYREVVRKLRERRRPALVVQPRIGSTGNLMLEVGLATSARQLPILDAGAAQVSAPDRGTLLLGGATPASGGSSGVPVLGRIPLLGKLFKSGSEEPERTALIVFLNPQLIQGVDR